jgi:hypothetical protein
MRVHNPDRSPFPIQRCHVAQTPTGFLEIGSDSCTLYGAGRSMIEYRRDEPNTAKLAYMNRMILPLLLVCLTFGGGCGSERLRDIQTHNENLNRLRIGMTTKKVAALVGPPIRSEQSATAAGTKEWYYTDPLSGQGAVKVTFTDGRVSSVQSVSAIP